MIGILLLVLKIIGITLLVILGLTILLILIILFMPILYSVNGTMHTDIDTLEIQGRVTWLCGLVRVDGKYKYPHFDWSGFVAWYQLNEEKRKTSKKRKQSKQYNMAKTKENDEQNLETERTIEPESIEPKSTEPKSTKVLNEDTLREKHDFSSTGQKKKFKILHIFRKICDTIQMILHKKDKVLELYYIEEHQYTIAKCKELLSELWRKIRPKKCCITANIGFEDPALTGKMLGGLGVLLPFYGDTIHVKPDFEEIIYDGTIDIKGSFCIFPLAVVFIKLVLDKKIKITYNNIKEFEL